MIAIFSFNKNKLNWQFALLVLFIFIPIHFLQAAEVTKKYYDAATGTVDASNITSGTTVRLRIGLVNNSGAALTGAQITDNLPSNASGQIIVASPVNVRNNTCGNGTTTGVVSTTTNSVSITNATIPVSVPSGSAACTFDVDVIGQATTALNLNNNIPAGALTFNPPNPTQNSTLPYTQGMTLSAITSPSATLNLSKNTVLIGETVNLTVSVTNNSTLTDLNSTTWSIVLPTNISVAGTAALSSTGGSSCGAGATINASGSNIDFGNGTILKNAGHCDVVIPIYASATGSYNNITLLANYINNTQWATKNVDTTAPTLAVQTIDASKAFTNSAGTVIASIQVGVPFRAEVSIMNSGNVTYSGVSITDNFPTNLKLSNASSPVYTATGCGTGHSVTQIGSNAGFTFSGGTLSPATFPNSTTCKVSVEVIATSTTGITNNIPSSNISTTLPAVAHPFTNPITASITPSAFSNTNISIVKAPVTTPIAAGQTGQFTITLTNNSTVNYSNITVTDNLQASNTNVTLNSISGNTCPSLTSSNIAGNSSLSFTGGTLNAGQSCVITITVNAPNLTASAVTYNNAATVNYTHYTGQAGTDTKTSSTVGLTVNPLSFTKSKTFTPSSIIAGDGQTPTLDIAVTNNSGIDFTGMTINDPLLNNMKVASFVSNTCGTDNNPAVNDTIIALTTANHNTVNLASGATCHVIVTVNPLGGSNTYTSNLTANNTATIAFYYYAGQITPTTTTAANSLTINAVPVTITKSFAAPKTTYVGGTKQVTLTVLNSSSANLTNLNIYDQASGSNLPAGLTYTSLDSTTNCGTLTNGSTANKLSLTGGSLAAGGTCTVVFTTTATSTGTKNNGSATSFNFFSGQTTATTKTSANDSLIVTDLSATKNFSNSTISVGGTSVITITVSNWSTTATKANISFTDTISTRLAVATPSVYSNTCGGTFAPVAGAPSVTLSGGSLPVAPALGTPSTCTLTFTVVGLTSNGCPGGLTNTIAVTATGATTSPGNTTASYCVGALTTGFFSFNSKVFSISSILPNHISRATVDWRYTQNGAGNPSTANAIVVDHLPAGLTVATPDNTVVQCENGTNNNYVTITSLTTTKLNSVTISSPARDSITVDINNQSSGSNRDCRVSFDVTGSAVGAYSNVMYTSDITTITANVANGSTTSVNAPLTITNNIGFNPVTKAAFSPASILAGATSQVAVTWINNAPAGNAAATNIDFTDNLPTNVTVAATPNVLYSCNGAADTAVLPANITIPLARNKITVRLPVSQARTIPCTIKFNVTATVASSGLGYPNTIQIGDIVSADDTNFENYAASGTVYLQVTAGIDFSPVTKSFTPSSILPNSPSTVAIAWKNNASAGTPAISNVQVVDILPTDLSFASPLTALYNCTGTDFPITPTIVGQQITLLVPSQNAQQTCTVKFNVTSNIIGSYSNAIAIGGITSLTDSAYSNSTASTPVSLTVTNAIGFGNVSKSFLPLSILAGGTSTASVVWKNNAPTGTAAITNVDMIDTLPNNVKVASPSNALYNCGSGNVLVTPTITALSATQDKITIRVPSQATGVTCTAKFDVTSNTAGTYVNNIPIGKIVSADNPAFANLTASSPDGTLTVTGDIGVSKAFVPDNLGNAGISQLTITLTNKETVTLAGVTLTDNLPTVVGNPAVKLLVANPSNASTTCPNGDITTNTVSGTAQVKLVGASIPARQGSVNGSCSVTVDVVASFGSVTSGTLTNTIAANAVTSTSPVRSNSSASNNATITIATPTITASKSFTPASVAGRAASTLTVNIKNPQTFAQTGISFVDDMTNAGQSLAANNLVVSSSPNVTSDCGTSTDWTFTKVGGGALTGGESKWQFSGGIVPAKSGGIDGSCNISIDVVPQLEGAYINTIPANSITTDNGSKNVTDVVGSVISVAGVAVTKSFVPNPALVGETVRLTLTLGNSSLTRDFSNGAMVDTFPSGLQIINTSNMTQTCIDSTGAVTPFSGNVILDTVSTPNSITITNGVIPHNSSCLISVDISPRNGGDYTNTVAEHALSVKDSNNNVYYNEYAGSATAIVNASLKIVKIFNPSTDTGVFDFSLTPSASSGVSTLKVDKNTNFSTVTPFYVNGGTTYTITEIGDGLTNVTDYTTTYSCSDADGTVLTSGTGTTFSITPPVSSLSITPNQQNIICTVTNKNKITGVNIPYDYGDAPNSYGTNVRHTIGSIQNDVQVFNNNLYLGAIAPDTETADDPTTGANGDDNAGMDDEDAFSSLPEVSITDTSYTLSNIAVTNSTGSSATLYAWIDFNKNGVFDSTEFKSASVANGASSVTLPSWTGLTSLTTGQTYARFRLTTQSLGSSGFAGAVSDGEVEDYTLNIINTPPTLTLNKISAGGVNSFGYTLTNTTQATASVTTETAGVTKQVDSDTVTAGTQNFTISTIGQVVTITEDALSSDWRLSSANCSGLKSGDTATLDTNTRTLTIPATSVISGATLSCTFTNSKIPTVKVKKTTLGGFGGPFTFAQSNLVGSPSQILTTSANSVEPAFPTSVFVSNIGADITITETPYSGYSATSASCTDANNLIAGNFGSLAGNVLTIPAINVIAGADITCIFTNTNGVSRYVISGTVFKDIGTGSGIANDAIQNGSELGLAGVSVKLTNCNAVTYATTTTDSGGNYSFSSSSAPAGTVCVEQTNLTGYTSIGRNVEGAFSSTYTSTNADKISFTLNNSANYNSLNFADVPANQFLTDGTQTGLPGTTLNYAHTFIAGTNGTVTFSLPTATALPVVNNWSQTLYTDSNCNAVLDSSEALAQTSTSAITVTAGQTICLIQKEFIPANAPTGATNLAPVKATFVYSNATSVTTTVPVAVTNDVLTRQDLTMVTDTALALFKEVRNIGVDGLTDGTWGTSNTAKSNELLEYRLTYTNNGVKAINNLVINDATPPFTTFILATAKTPLPANLTLCKKTTPFSPTVAITCATSDTATANNTGGIKWIFTGSLSSGGVGSVTYRVKVD